MTLANIHHLQTGITGRAHPNTTAADLARALHPTPAVGGRPREEAAAFIEANESDGRGWFAGPVGWIDLHGDVDLAVALRSAVIDRDSVTTFAGAGIVAGSDPVKELRETETKMDAMRRALAGTEP
jgi:isochorismate synthase EntC